MREEDIKTETGTKRDGKRERKREVDNTNFTSVVSLTTVAEIWGQIRVRYIPNQHPYTIFLCLSHITKARMVKETWVYCISAGTESFRVKSYLTSQIFQELQHQDSFI